MLRNNIVAHVSWTISSEQVNRIGSKLILKNNPFFKRVTYMEEEYEQHSFGTKKIIIQ